MVLWSDPSAAIQSLRGKPLARVRTEQVQRLSQLQEASKLTTTGGLELDLLVLRPGQERPTSLVIIALDSQGILEAANALPESSSCAFALISCQFQDEQLFDLRRSAERSAASFLAAWDELRGQPWATSAALHLVGQRRTASPALLAAAQLDPGVQAWALGAPPPSPSGVRDRLTHALAFGGSRTPTAMREEQLPADLGSGLEWLQARLDESPKAPPH